MKKLLMVFVAGITLFLFTGCMGSNKMVYNSLNQTQVVLSQNNFTVVGTAEGTFSTSYIFGLGGSSKSAMRENAVQQMFKNAQLKGSQTIIDVSYSTSVRTVLGIYIQKVVTAHGVIIEFK